MRRSTILALLLLVVFVVKAFAATTTSTALPITGLRGLTFSVYAATTGDVVATDGGTLGTRRDQITRKVAGGQTQYELTRFTFAANGTFVDQVAAITTTALATAIDAFDFSSTAPGHPAPTKDSVDTEVKAALVGYTGS